MAVKAEQQGLDQPVRIHYMLHVGYISNLFYSKHQLGLMDQTTFRTKPLPFQVAMVQENVISALNGMERSSITDVHLSESNFIIGYHVLTIQRLIHKAEGGEKKKEASLPKFSQVQDLEVKTTSVSRKKERKIQTTQIRATPLIAIKCYRVLQ